MPIYLDFKDAECKDCYRCLRECPVKAIEVKNHQARIIEDRCILCGRCTEVCPQNAKNVHSERPDVEKLLSSQKVIASIAPSFVSSFGVNDFNAFKLALGKLRFADAEETAVGARAVIGSYRELIESGKYKNIISSACPAANRMIQTYYPKALPYLAPVMSPMVAHAKILKERFPDSKIVFVGPCIAKKREAVESGLIDGVLTFEELNAMFQDKGIDPKAIDSYHAGTDPVNRAKFFPIAGGIIKSFDTLNPNYEYIAVDGVDRLNEMLKNIDDLTGMFIEVSACDHACINGPQSICPAGKALKRNGEIRSYATKDLKRTEKSAEILPEGGYDLPYQHPRLRAKSFPVTDRDINAILARMGKTRPEDELNCGACGYSGCREKAWAVANGYADVEMCLPYMRERAETMSYEIIENSPNGIVVSDYDLRILHINSSAKELLGIADSAAQGKPLSDYTDAMDFVMAVSAGKNAPLKRIRLSKTNRYAELTITLLPQAKIVFGVYKDITSKVNFDEQLDTVRKETLETTDAIIKKQMRVAQEIASLLGETTAETKVALVNLKKMLTEQEENDKWN